jgi:ATP-dependent DNA ligase
LSIFPKSIGPDWGERMTVDEMNKCIWVKPKLVAQIEFLEWTDADHLRHSKFVGLREDKNAQKIVSELAAQL